MRKLSPYIEALRSCEFGRRVKLGVSAVTLAVLVSCASTHPQDAVQPVAPEPVAAAATPALQPDSVLPPSSTLDSVGLPAAPADNGPQMAESSATQYAALATAESNGAVQVFSLDGPAPNDQTAIPDDMSAMPPSPVQGSMQPPMQMAALPEPQGMPYGRDPNVEVFPLDGQGPIAGVPGGNGMAPPSQVSDAGQQNPSQIVMEFGWPVNRADGKRIYFKNGSAAIGGTGRDSINSLIEAAAKGALISVEGHASTRAVTKNPKLAHIVNLKISMQRAFSVSQALIKKGVPAPNIRTTAWGDTQPPAISTPDKDEESESRRVDIFMQPK